MDKNGFSLIEVVMVIGIISSIIPAAYVIGLPEYDRYISRSQKEAFVDQLFDARFSAIIKDEDIDVLNTDSRIVGKFSGQGSFTSSTTSTTTVLKIGEYEIKIDEFGLVDGS